MLHPPSQSYGATSGAISFTCRVVALAETDGSSTDEQRSSSGKDRQPGGLFSGRRLAALLLGHRALRLCSLVAPCQPPAIKTARPFLIYEVGSGQLGDLSRHSLLATAELSG